MRETPTSPPTGIFTFLGGLVLLAVFAGLVVLWVRHNVPSDDLNGRRSAQRIETRTKLSETQVALASSYGWVDARKGVAHIPVPEAMKLTVAELKTKQPVASSVKVEPVLPVAVPDPNATEPPPLNMPSAPQGAVNIRFDTREARGPEGAVSAPASAPTALPPVTTPVQSSEPHSPAPPKSPGPALQTQPDQSNLPRTPGPVAPAQVPPPPSESTSAPSAPVPPTEPAPAPAPNPAPAAPPASAPEPAPAATTPVPEPAPALPAPAPAAGVPAPAAPEPSLSNLLQAPGPNAD